MQNYLPHQRTAGFSLIEMMVVISIIGLLATVVLGSLGTARDQAKYARAVKEMNTIATAAAQYKFDTGIFPSQCDATCDSTTDPFLNSLGVTGWSGPYDSVWDKAHPWGGSYSISQYDVGSVNQFLVVLDDDRPNTSYTDNQGTVSTEVLVAIDNLLDNGDLATGVFFGDNRDEYAGPGASRCPAGEGCWAPF